MSSAARPELSASADGSAIDVLTLATGTDLEQPAVRCDAQEALEGGSVILLPKAGFELTARERALLSDLRNILAREPDGANGRPTIIFDPARGKIANFNYAFSGWRLVRAEIRRAVLPELEAMMVRFGGWAEGLHRPPAAELSLGARARPHHLSPEPAQRRTAAARRFGLRLSDTGPRDAARLLQHRPARSAARLAARRTVRALRAPLRPGGAPAAARAGPPPCWPASASSAERRRRMTDDRRATPAGERRRGRISAPRRAASSSSPAARRGSPSPTWCCMARSPASTASIRRSSCRRRGCAIAARSSLRILERLSGRQLV